MSDETKTLPAQHQDQQPGIQSEMVPEPATLRQDQPGSGKLRNMVAIITGGDSGIGRAVAVAFAREGADVAIVYLSEHQDAEHTCHMVSDEGRKCILIAGDIGSEEFCRECATKTIEAFGKINILVNNAAEQHPQKSILDITEQQLIKTFRTNIFAQFFMTKAVLPHLHEGDTIINTASVTHYKGAGGLIDYAATKGAIVAFTRSLSESLADQKIRVNAVAPGPIWTPLIPSTFTAEEVETFGADTPMKRPGQPEEVAPCYVFLASEDSSYMSGQTLHPNGGTIING